MKNLTFKWKYLAPVIGALAGYAYYYFIGCASGQCPIQSNPYLSTLYGGLMGAVFMMPDKKKNESSERMES